MNKKEELYSLIATDIPDIMALSEILSKTPTLPVVEEYYNIENYGSASDSMMARPKAIHFSWLGPELFVYCLVHRGSNDDLLLLQIFSGVV